MNKIIFTNLNKELVTKVKKIHKETTNNIHCELIAVNLDVLKAKKKYPDALIVTASNPDFSMGGGLDAVLKKEYLKECINPREFKFTDNLFFVKSCDENLKTNKKIIQRALLGVYFASRKNDIIITGIGTQIARLSINDFLDEYKKFIFANFGFADFSSANFYSANFSFANFSSANFNFADFSSANFSSANFSSADFYSADFSSANFNFADFSSANFSSANFYSANFYSANFYSANFYFAKFTKTRFNFRIVPGEGDFIGWKKARGKVLKLKIINAKNSVGGLTGRKCRCKKVKVLEIQELDGTKTNLKEISSDYNKEFIYKLNKIIEVKDWDSNKLIECTKGIHFFITRDEAVRY